jgi:RNA methyltransferase, TrmH family
MLTKNTIRFILSLQRKKVRDEYLLFLLEGDKLIREYLASGRKLHLLAAKPEWIKQIPEEQLEHTSEIIPVKYEELKKVSHLKTPHNALAVAYQSADSVDAGTLRNKLFLMLDEVQDPGNLGSILRIAAWFGITRVFCSPKSVDVYNPKVIQASMGSFLHVSVHYRELLPLAEELKELGVPLYGTTLQGKPLHQLQLPSAAGLLLGNESRGLSEELVPLLTEELLIPAYSETGAGLDSLNVAMAAAIACYEFRR